MGVCASSDVEPSQDTLSVDIDYVEPIDPRELHARCVKILEMNRIIPTLMLPYAIQAWRKNSRLAFFFTRVVIRSVLQEWQSKTIHTPLVRKKLNKRERIRNEVAILAELRASRR